MNTKANYNFYSKTTTKFTCAKVECPSYFTRLRDPCYYQYDKDSCCEVKKYCRKLSCPNV